ncbi:MAG: polysaccharide deacetylase family protein [Bacteroidota bacterium]
MNIIMFHSVGNAQSDWYRKWLSTDIDQFEALCQYLKKKKYHTILLDDWYHLQNFPQKITGKEILLTFDDGFLDNWVFAYPILKKYGLKGTIFINPEFVDPNIKIRMTIEDVWNKKCTKEELTTLGYANWAEIKKMDTDKVLDVQSHSMSHNFYFNSNKVVDIFEGQQEYDWMAWNSHPELKPFSLSENQLNLIPEGTPIFSNYRALGLRRYFPDEELTKKSIELYSKTKDKSKCIEYIENNIPNFPGRFETDSEMDARFRYELFESKLILEKQLDKKVNFLCWPGGGYNELSINISKEAGYIASTISSREVNVDLDNSSSYKRIQRFGIGSFLTTKKQRHFVKSNQFLIETFLGRSGNNFYRNILRYRKLKFLIKDFLTK